MLKRHPHHDVPGVRRYLFGGLLVALLLTVVLIAAVLTSFLPGYFFAGVASIGMAALVFNDLRRRGDRNAVPRKGHPPQKQPPAPVKEESKHRFGARV